MDAPAISPVRNADNVSEAVEEVVDEQPWLETVTRLGWFAKGAVYWLMGLTAFTIGRHQPTSDEASPEGAVAQIVKTRGGTFLLGTLAIGLVLYAAWRVLSAALIRGNGLHEWLERVGYLFSAAFYALLATTAVMAVLRGDSPEDKNTVERLSSWMLGSSVGRWVLFVGGAVAIAVGVYFVVQKGLRKSFLDDLRFGGASRLERRAVTWTGVAGWIGRGLVTVAVGWFVLQAAWEADSSDARGFDQALRELAEGDVGSILVTVAGVALVLYGVFCILSVRHLELE